MTKSKFQIFRSKYILYALIAILIMLIIGVGTSLYAKNKIKDQLQRIDNLTYKDLNVNFFLGNVELNEINYSWLKEKEDTSRITIRTVDLGGISFWKLLKENKLIIDQLSISGSECQILELPKFEINDTSRTASKDEFKDITIKKLKLQNSSIDYTDSVGWHLTIANADIELDSISYSNDSLNYKDLVCSIYKINHVTKNGLHDFSLSKVKANSLDGSIQLDSLSIFPKHSWASWKNHVPWKKARLHFDAPKIEIAGVNFDNLIDNPSFVSELLVVNDAHLRVQVDEDIDVCNSCYKAFVHEKLLKANLPINIEKAEVKNSSIYVEAYDKSDQRLIDVEFDNLYASIYNVTNIDTIIASNPKIIADVQTLFAKQSQLKTQIQFALNDPNYGYVIDAELGAIDLLDFNKKIQKGAKLLSNDQTIYKLLLENDELISIFVVSIKTATQKLNNQPSTIVNQK